MKRHHLSFADWSCREYAVILRCLLSASISKGKFPAILTDRLAQFYAPSSVYLCNYGHHAIQIALTIFKRRQPMRNEVIVPAYICPSVVQAIHACGLLAISVEVEDDLNLSPAAMREAFGPATLAVIAPHMYGCPAQIDEIEKWCRTAGVFLIDDAAQVVGMRHKNRLLGTFGDVGIISFAQSKTIVTGIRGSGGVLLVNQSQYDLEAKQAWRMLPAAQGRLAALADFMWNYIWGARTGNSAYYLSRVCSAIGVKRTPNKIATKISNLDAGIAFIQLERLATILQEKIRIAETYYQMLQAHPQIQFPQYAAGRFLARVMLQLPNTVDAGRFRDTLKTLGLETRLGYDAYLSPKTTAHKAEKFANHLLGVPCRAGMRTGEIEDICNIMDKALHRASQTQ